MPAFSKRTARLSMSGRRGAPNAFAAVCSFDLNKKRDKLHLLLGLRKTLLDIDKAIKNHPRDRRDANVIPNLMEGFGIDKIQAEFMRISACATSIGVYPEAHEGDRSTRKRD